MSTEAAGRTRVLVPLSNCLLCIRRAFCVRRTSQNSQLRAQDSPNWLPSPLLECTKLGYHQALKINSLGGNYRTIRILKLKNTLVSSRCSVPSHSTLAPPPPPRRLAPSLSGSAATSYGRLGDSTSDASLGPAPDASGGALGGTC